MHQVQQHRSRLRGIEAMTLMSDHHFPRHSHDQFGIGVLTCGAQRSWSGIGQVEAGAGDIIMVNPGEIHDGVPAEGRARSWRMIYLDPSVVDAQLEGETTTMIDIVRPVARDPQLADCFARAFACLATDRPDPLAREESLCITIMAMARRHGTVRPSSSGPTPSVARALRRLHSAPELPVSLAELAALSGVSRFQLLRGFAREIGITPHAYLVQRRVLLARRLLAEGRPLAQAAAQAGFADQSHMSRAFVRQFGITPGRFQMAIA